MRRGQIVELADAGELFDNPLHPYTRHLMRAIPTPDPFQRRSQPAATPSLPEPAPAPIREVTPGHWARV